MLALLTKIIENTKPKMNRKVNSRPETRRRNCNIIPMSILEIHRKRPPVPPASGEESINKNRAQSPLYSIKLMESWVAARICLLQIKFPKLLFFLRFLFWSIIVIRTGYLIYNSLSSALEFPTCHMMPRGGGGGIPEVEPPVVEVMSSDSEESKPKPHVFRFGDRDREGHLPDLNEEPVLSVDHTAKDIFDMIHKELFYRF